MAEEKKISFRGVEMVYKPNLDDSNIEQYLITQEQKIAIDEAIRKASKSGRVLTAVARLAVLLRGGDENVH